MAKKLSEIQNSVDRFIYEAKMCAEEEYGFAAMLTIFPVILSISEAVNLGQRGNRTLLEGFLAKMNDKTSWVILPRSVKFSDTDVAEKLANARDSLAHQFSLPSEVFLANNRSEAQEIARKYPKKYVFSTTEFISVVEQTVHNLIAANSNVVFDPKPGKLVRDAADRYILVSTTAPPISGSSSEL